MLATGPSAWAQNSSQQANVPKAVVAKPASGNPSSPDIKINVPLVTLDVGVLSKDGMFIPGLKKEHFRVSEDGVPQTIVDFNQVQAPITALMLVEFANNDYFYQFAIDSVTASYTFATGLKKEDWIAVMTYDLKPHVLQDFTQDKGAVRGAIATLKPGMAMSQETNLLDSLYEALDRLEAVQGRKYIILVSSGRDSFSKKSLDMVLKKVQASKDIVIYSIGTGQALRNWAEQHGYMRYLCPAAETNCQLAFNLADNQLQAFSRMTGGKWYLPLFPGSFRDAFMDVANTIRDQYSISYQPTNRAQDGSFRKIKVELVNESGQPLAMKNEKGIAVKYQIIAREGYKARLQAE